MTDAQRNTLQTLIGAVLAIMIVGVVSYLAITAQAEGERNLLIGILGGGFGGAVGMFLGNMQQHRPPPTAKVEQAGVVNQASPDPPPVS